MRKFVALLLALVAASTGAAAQDMRLLAPGTLRIGTYFVNPPFEFVDKGEKVGFEVDLMNEIAARLKLRPAYVDTTWEKILQQMQDGLYDCIVGGITITAARQRTLAYSTPYMTTTLSLVVNREKSPDLKGAADLRTAIVGLQAATTDYDVALQMQKRGEIGGIKVYPFDRIEEAMVDLAAGRITAVMKVAPVAAWLAQKTPSLRVVAQVPTTRSRSASASGRTIPGCWPRSTAPSPT
jgi:ABC-type amino acid transport substrate-binding protein